MITFKDRHRSESIGEGNKNIRSKVNIIQYVTAIERGGGKEKKQRKQKRHTFQNIVMESLV